MTQNNNQSMKTVVETFIIEETQELIYDNEKLDQWNSFVSDLGLTGQTKILVKDKSPIPYLFMNNSMVNVFEVLCPRKVNISEYDKTPIPVEILSLVSLSKKEEHFYKIEIWYNDSNPDPACIGFKCNSSFDKKYPTWGSGFDKYLIGRWADVKMSLDQLTEKAKSIFKIQRTDSLNKDIAKAKRELEDLDITVNESFGNVLPSIDLP